MPTKTFFRLPEEKRKKIEKALVTEFSRTPFSKISISNIVEEAKIPRGSFYQYFTDKEDAIRYIVEEFLKMEQGEIKGMLRKNEGDVFATSLAIFDYVVEKTTDDEEMKLYQNIMQELKKENINIFQGVNIKYDHSEKMPMNEINLEHLAIVEDNDLEYMLKIITYITRNASIRVISGKRTKEEGRKELEKEIAILKRGMLKSN